MHSKGAFPPSAIECELAVALLGLEGGPFPAMAGLVHLGPELIPLFFTENQNGTESLGGACQFAACD